MIGLRFGALEVVALEPKATKTQARKWRVRCDCGAEAVVYGGSLRRGMTVSCGANQHRKGVNRTHGQSRTPLYNIWCGMKQRCSDPRAENWQHYGARGIKVCARWNNSFEAFLEDMGAGYASGLSIERRDVDGDYELSNCTWIPRRHQARNKTTTHWMESPWGRLILSDVAERIGINPSTLHERIQKGWAGDRLFAPSMKPWLSHARS